MVVVSARKVENAEFACSIEYFTQPTVSIDDTVGFFSFSYYLRNEIIRSKKSGPSIYLFGIMSYIYLCHHFEPFHKWKLVIYTDKQTYEFIQSQKIAKANVNLPPAHQLQTVEIQGYNAKIGHLEKEGEVYGFIEEHPPFSTGTHPIQFASSYTDLYEPYMVIKEENKGSYDFQTNLLYYALLQDPRVVWAIVDWPAKSTGPELKKIHEPTLRCFRFRSPFDFPNAFHFIRDADTLHQSYFNRHSPFLYIHSLAYALFLHETEFLAFLQEKQAGLSKPLFVVGTMKGSYVKDWHINNLYGKSTKTSVGFLAGYVNTSPGLACFTEDLWTRCLEYIDTRVKKLANNTFSNNAKKLVAVGRDEQLLLYVIAPACLDSFVLVDVNLYGSVNPDDRLHLFQGVSQFLNKTPVKHVNAKDRNNWKGLSNSEIISEYLGKNYSKNYNGVYPYKSFFEIQEDSEKEALYKANVEKWKTIRIGGRKTRRLHKKRSYTYKKK